MTWSASSRPVEFDVAAHQVVEHELALARHLQAHHAFAPLGLEAGAVGGGGGHPAAAVLEPPLLRLGRLALAVHLFGRGVVAVGRPFGDQLVDRGLVARAALRLEVGRVAGRRPPALRPSPAPASGSRAGWGPGPPRRCVAGRCRRCAGRTCRRATGACEQPVEQRRADAADVQVAGRAGGESRSDGHQVILSPGLAPSGSSAPSKVTRRWGRSPPPAARIIPSDRPNFIWRGFKLATTATVRPTSTAGSG